VAQERAAVKTRFDASEVRQVLLLTKPPNLIRKGLVTMRQCLAAPERERRQVLFIVRLGGRCESGLGWRSRFFSGSSFLRLHFAARRILQENKLALFDPDCRTAG
jgi:hypothetical protein